MGKIFEGTKFLDDRAVTLNLSNGKHYDVREVMPEVMADISKLEKEGNENANAMREILSKITSVEPKELKDLGMVEMKGAVDFLLESLFDMKPQN